MCENNVGAKEDVQDGSERNIPEIQNTLYILNSYGKEISVTRYKGYSVTRRNKRDTCSTLNLI